MLADLIQNNQPGISPSDSGQAAKALVEILKESKPTYIRCTGDQSIKPIYTEDFDFKIGKSITLNE